MVKFIWTSDLPESIKVVPLTSEYDVSLLSVVAVVLH